jgi:predicted transposase YbfD/YdcC
MSRSNSSDQLKALLARFEGITDIRIERKKLYPLNEILFLSISGVVSGYSEWDEIVDFGEEKLEWLRQYLPYKNGIPSHDTVNRVLGLIDYRSFETFFIEWVESLSVSLGGKVINIDGKKLRSSVDKQLQQTSHKEGGKSAIHLVEAWCSEVNLCLGQYKTEDKSNEITAIPALLDLLEIAGSTITIDAMGCQKEIAGKIIKKDADYILGLKDNQPTLYTAVQELFAQQQDFEDSDVQESFGHGRFDVRHCRTLSAALLDESFRTQWPGLNMLIKIESERFIQASQQYSLEYRYYLGSKVQSAAQCNEQIRQHWAIENQLHWTMDVTFGEDGSRKRKNNAAQNFGLFRRMALNLLKTNGEKEKVSINRRMNRCALSDKYRENTLKF